MDPTEPQDPPPKASGTPNPKALPVDETWASPDAFLTALGDVVNDTDVEIGMRLVLSGTVISGLMISGSRHFDLLSETMQNAAEGGETPDVYESFAEVFTSMAEQYRARRSQWEEGLEDDVRTTYVHMREAWLHAPGGAPLELGLWRGRLAAITGWSWGNYVETR